MLSSLGLKTPLNKIPLLADPLLSKAINGETIILSKCAVCKTKSARFIKKQEAKGSLNNLGTRTTLSKIPILRDIFF